MKWQAQISGNEEALDALLKLDFENITFLKEEKYYLESTLFDANLEYDDIETIAKEIVDNLNSILMLKISPNLKINFENIRKILKDGKVVQILKVGHTSMTLSFGTVSMKIIKPDGSTEIRTPYDNLPENLNLALNDNNIKRVYRLLSTYNFDWFNLYKILEVIKDDLGGEINISEFLKISLNQIHRFKNTANNERAVGILESRHAISDREKTINPMNVSEAKDFILDLIKKWENKKLETKK